MQTYCCESEVCNKVTLGLVYCCHKEFLLANQHDLVICCDGSGVLYFELLLLIYDIRS